MGQIPVGDPGQNYSGAKSEHQRQALERRLLRTSRGITARARPAISTSRARPASRRWRLRLPPPTRCTKGRLAESAKGDANDALWAIEAIRNYNPEPDLDKIKR